MKSKRMVLPKATPEETEQNEKKQRELLRLYKLREKSPLFEFDKTDHGYLPIHLYQPDKKLFNHGLILRCVFVLIANLRK